MENCTERQVKNSRETQNSLHKSRLGPCERHAAPNNCSSLFSESVAHMFHRAQSIRETRNLDHVHCIAPCCAIDLKMC